MAKQISPTKEYFDRQFGHLEGMFDEKLKANTKELKEYVAKEIAKEVAGLARMTSHGFDEVYKRLDVIKRVEKLEYDFTQLKNTMRI